MERKYCRADNGSTPFEDARRDWCGRDGASNEKASLFPSGAPFIKKAAA
jgi:hypothetical protein